VERSAETTRDDPDGESLKRNRRFESGSLQRRVREPSVPRGASRSAIISTKSRRLSLNRRPYYAPQIWATEAHRQIREEVTD
jgi:hypothetical protein